jgi:glucosyl-dolichyl phosphate glucuronosyltransferase
MAVENTNPLITVAICTRNRAKLLERTIRSVLPQLTDETELLIVDNNSTDGTRETIQRLTANELRVAVCKEEKIGGTVARNTAIKKARGQYVLFLDDDAAAEPGWLNAYRQFLVAPPSDRIAAVGGAHYPEYEISPPQWIGAERNKIDLWPLPARFPYGGSAGECNCVFLRSAVVQAGLFDERLGHTGRRSGTGEGPDLHLRLQNAGWEIWWLPGATVRDFFPASRLNFRSALNAAFNDGRSTAIRRVKCCRNWMSRMAYGIGRIAITPVHAFANILMGLFMLPVSHVKAAEHFLRVYHSCGLAWQLLSGWSETMHVSRVKT